MIVDSSALLAILLDEGDADRFLRAITDAADLGMSAANYLEAAIVSDSRGTSQTIVEMDAFLARVGIVVEPVTHAHARIARDAYRAYGKGNHPAGLNFGDCFAYALARATDRPLLFKGADFAATDIAPALFA